MPASQRKREKLLEKAKSAQDRETVQKENRIFRVNLIFSNEQADIVKPVLGERPAEAMLELCRAELDRRQG